MPRTLCIPYLGAWRRDSRYSGKYSILCCFFSFIICSFFFSLFRLPLCEGRRETLQVSDWPIFATLPLFRYLFLQQQNLIEIYNEQQIEEKERPTGIKQLFLFLALDGVGVGGLQTSHFFLWQSKHFGIQSSGFTLEAISQVGPTLVWERTSCFCSLRFFLFFDLLCF